MTTLLEFEEWVGALNAEYDTQLKLDVDSAAFHYPFYTKEEFLPEHSYHIQVKHVLSTYHFVVGSGRSTIDEVKAQIKKLAEAFCNK